VASAVSEEKSREEEHDQLMQKTLPEVSFDSAGLSVVTSDLRDATGANLFVRSNFK
jgi:hypothetical protein